MVAINLFGHPPAEYYCKKRVMMLHSMSDFLWANATPSKVKVGLVTK